MTQLSISQQAFDQAPIWGVCLSSCLYRHKNWDAERRAVVAHSRTWQKLPDWMLATLPCFQVGGSAKWYGSLLTSIVPALIAYAMRDIVPM